MSTMSISPEELEDMQAVTSPRMMAAAHKNAVEGRHQRQRARTCGQAAVAAL